MVDFRITVIGESSGNEVISLPQTRGLPSTRMSPPAAYRPEHGFQQPPHYMAECVTYFTPALWIAAPFQRVIRLLALVSMQLHEWIREPLISPLLIPDLPLSLDLAVWTEEPRPRRLSLAVIAYRRKNLLLQTYGCKYCWNRAPRSWRGLEGHFLTRQHSTNSNLVAREFFSLQLNILTESD